jgi:hypothetical protein
MRSQVGGVLSESGQMVRSLIGRVQRFKGCSVERLFAYMLKLPRIHINVYI